MLKSNQSFHHNPNFYETLNFVGSAISNCAGAAINFFRGADEVTKAKNIIAKYFKENGIDVKRIDGKSHSCLFILTRLINNNLYTEENFELLQKMDKSEFKEGIGIFNEIVYILQRNKLLNKQSFNMAYNKINDLKDTEKITLEALLFDLEKKNYLMIQRLLI